MALDQIRQGREIATRIVDLYRTHSGSPQVAQAVLNTDSIVSNLVISAFCADYYYQFDPARRISRVFDLAYRFNHDLVLAHCFKCNLSDGKKPSGEGPYDFADALGHVWTLTELHRQIQATDSVDGVRALFFDYVLAQPDIFAAVCVDLFKSHQKTIKRLEQVSRQAAIARKSQLVADVSNPTQEKDTFLGSAEYGFPTAAYQQSETVTALQNYYQGCTLLCDCLSSEFEASFQQEMLIDLFIG